MLEIANGFCFYFSDILYFVIFMLKAFLIQIFAFNNTNYETETSLNTKVFTYGYREFR